MLSTRQGGIKYFTLWEPRELTKYVLYTYTFGLIPKKELFNREELVGHTLHMVV
jgi:hypothetical protein